ncbi:MAG TPA: PfkB family carbohydrate kinase [Candidatus Methylomirabilis sp.]|nr:PfkB family carbohydrate kinase [Candidatus Methylomirabilis sp.]
MTATTDFDILMIGHFAKDRLVVDGQAEEASGGAVFYGSVAVRRLGIKVAIATRLHPDDFPRLDELRREGVEVFATPAAATTGIENIYHSADMERRICKPLSFAGPFQLPDLPAVTAKVILIVPIIAGEVDLPLLKAVAQRGPVGMDVQGFVRVRERGELVFRQWPDMRVGLSHVTYLKVDKAEAELLTGETDLGVAARKLAVLGPREIVLTQSSGVTVYADGHIYQAPFTPRSLAGRTGRGDTCFATYVARRLRTSPEEACRWAGAVTTLKQERPGPWRGALADVEALLAGRSRP